MKFFPGQRVRIKSIVQADPPALQSLRGEIVHIVCGYSHFGHVEQWYQVDVRTSYGDVVVAESALEPVFDAPEKISWSHSAVVWKPREMDRAPAVIRRNRHKETKHVPEKSLSVSPSGAVDAATTAVAPRSQE